MLHTAPQHWSYLGSAFAPPTGYMTSSHSYQQNPYATTWAPQHSAYTGSNTSTAGMYPGQVMNMHSMPPPSLPQDHEPKYLPTTMTDSSPSTTSSASIGSVVADWTPLHAQEPSTELPHVCAFRGCGRAYKRKAELDRHTQEKHGPTSGRLLCPVKMCPRGIPGEGFDRMSHLTQHLRSGKHKMTPSQAKFMAREHNPRKGGKNG